MKTLAQPSSSLSKTFFSGSFVPMPLSPEGAAALRALSGRTLLVWGFLIGPPSGIFLV
jgi:hypothetical protein